MKSNQNNFAFIDASNLFYGGAKSLGWKIDYDKLLTYLKQKYGVSRVYYFGGAETHGFVYDYLNHDSVPLSDLVAYLTELIKTKSIGWDDASVILANRHLQRARFFLKLEEFGYQLVIKPVKNYLQADGSWKRKANCDVDMAFYLMRERDIFRRAVVLSGDGDFLPVLKYLKNQSKEVIILSRGPRTAKEIRQFCGSEFRDFCRLERLIKFSENKRK